MSKPRSVLAADPLPSPVSPPIEPTPPVTDPVEAALAALAQARRAPIEAAEAQKEAERRAQQEKALTAARALWDRAKPAARELARWKASAPDDERLRRPRLLGDVPLAALSRVSVERACWRIGSPRPSSPGC
jgi:hypothetical protein